MKLILVTFGGRQCTLQILFKYILKYRKHIHKYKIYVATEIATDISYMHEFASMHDFVELIYTIDNNDNMVTDRGYVWNRSYRECQESDCVYLKLDDDIIYMEESLFTSFIDFRIANPDHPLIYPVIINNFFIGWKLETIGVIDFNLKSSIGHTWPETYRRIKPLLQSVHGNGPKIGKITHLHEVLCPVGWGNLEYCIQLHNQFISDLKSQDRNSGHALDKYRLNWLLKRAEPVSISCCSWLGRGLADIIKDVGNVAEDEPWWTIYVPTWTNKYNMVYGNAIVGHYAYYRQRELGLDNTDILDKYKLIADNL